MTCSQAMSRLEALGNPRMREINARNGAGENQFGTKLGDVRALAKEIKSDHALALELWQTGNLEARFLSLLIAKPKQFSEVEVEEMVKAVDYSWLADWVMTHVVKLHPANESFRVRWMQESHPSLARAGWSLTAEKISKDANGLDLVALLDRIEADMADAHPLPQWTMNFALANIGIHFPEHRERALAIGEKLGVYRDYPVSKGCTSPFAPIWIGEMVRRQG